MTEEQRTFKLPKTSISLDDIYHASKTLEPVLYKTSLIPSSVFSKESGNNIFIKPENLQVTGAFKIRGAYYKISQLTEEEKSRGVVASSAGNHAQGVAYAAQLLGAKATLVMPSTTPIIKTEATKSYGAQVVLHGNTYDEAYQKARELEAKHGYVFIHPFDDLDVIVGQGTLALEILNELPDVDEIIVPIGGGGLISGIAFAAKLLKPSIKITGVEPEGASAMHQSLANGRLITLDKVDTMADGVAVKKPGTSTFEFNKQFVDEIITVPEQDIIDAILMLMEKHKFNAEGSGALALAALQKREPEGKNIVCLVSGGNIDISTISAIITRALVSRGRQFCFTVNLPDKPGELLQVAQILASLYANVIKLDYNHAKVMDRFKQVQLEVTVETNGHDHVRQIEKAFRDRGFEINKVY